MQFINLHLDQTADNKFVVTDNVSTLRGEGETVEEAIGVYIFKAFCGVPVSSSSIDPGIYYGKPAIGVRSGLTLGADYQQINVCDHEWETIYEHTGGSVRRCVKCMDLRSFPASL